MTIVGIDGKVIAVNLKRQVIPVKCKTCVQTYPIRFNEYTPLIVCRKTGKVLSGRRTASCKGDRDER